MIRSLALVLTLLAGTAMAVENKPRAEKLNTRGDASERALADNPIQKTLDDHYRRQDLTPEQEDEEFRRAWESATPAQRQQHSDYLDRLIGGQNPKLPKR
jgi:hypothetical protein